VLWFIAGITATAQTDRDAGYNAGVPRKNTVRQNERRDAVKPALTYVIWYNSTVTLVIKISNA
jgi:hypothetical protein